MVSSSVILVKIYAKLQYTFYFSKNKTHCFVLKRYFRYPDNNPRVCSAFNTDSLNFDIWRMYWTGSFIFVCDNSVLKPVFRLLSRLYIEKCTCTASQSIGADHMSKLTCFDLIIYVRCNCALCVWAKICAISVLNLVKTPQSRNSFISFRFERW